MTATASTLACSGCGAVPPDNDPYPFRCPNVGADDVDHVLVRALDPARVVFPRPGLSDEPFVVYRTLMHSYHRALAGGAGDDDYVALVDRLDRAVAEVDGHGFRSTPFGRSAELSDALGFRPSGGVWVKDETGNVAGSHKARHLMGVLLHLEVAELVGLADPRERPYLAIASCGNAALAAAVVSRAGGRRLRVFVPVEADARILARLRDLGVDVVICPRRPGVTGDPAYAGLRAALATGALPFTCQGPENGLVIEGGATLGYEMASELSAAGVLLDHLVVQVGGGALASACMQSLSDAARLGVLGHPPRIHTVQSFGAHPLERAYHLVAGLLPPTPTGPDIVEALRRAASRRSAYMWPWETEPVSLATGILDDETYDWRAVVEGMLHSGGLPVVASEARLRRAHELGRAAGFPVDPTGSSGLAGLLALRAEGIVGSDEKVAVVFTGRQR